MNSLGRYLPANFSATNPIVVDAGLPWEYIRIINNSPYLLSISFGNQGTIDFVENFFEDIPISKDFNGKITIVPIANFSTTAIASALSSLISINAYLPGEIKSPQAQPITTLAAVGNNLPVAIAANSVANDGNPANTVFIESSVGGITKISFTNDGHIIIEPITNGNNNIPALEVVPGGGAGVFAIVKMDNGAIATDGQGNFLINGASTQFTRTALGIKRTYILFHPSDGANKWGIVQESNGDFGIEDQTGTHIHFRAVAGAGNQMDDGNIVTDGAGNVTIKGLTTTTTPIMATGNQESGHLEFQNWSTNTGSNYEYWISFKEQMTNVPSSITLSNVVQTNVTVGSTSANNITKYGFSISIASASTGFYKYAADWVTVGN